MKNFCISKHAMIDVKIKTPVKEKISHTLEELAQDLYPKCMKNSQWKSSLSRWHVSRNLNETRDPVMPASGGRTAQEERAASAKGLRRKHTGIFKVQHGDKWSKGCKIHERWTWYIWTSLGAHCDPQALEKHWILFWVWCKSTGGFWARNASSDFNLKKKKFFFAKCMEKWFWEWRIEAIC